VIKVDEMYGPAKDLKEVLLGRQRKVPLLLVFLSVIFF